MAYGLPANGSSPTLPPLPSLPALQLAPPGQGRPSKRTSSRPASAGSGATSPSSSPSRSFSFSSRTRAKSTGMFSQLLALSPNSSPESNVAGRERAGTSPASGRNARPAEAESSASGLRRSQSEEALSARSLIPHDSGTDALFEQARLKLYSNDSEAMQRARSSLMEVSGGSSSASGTGSASIQSGGSPISPSTSSHPSTSTDSHTSAIEAVLSPKRKVIQRRSTLSNEIRPDAREADNILGNAFDPERDKQLDLDRIKSASINRSRSGSLSLLKEVTRSRHLSPDYIIAVVGATGSGKSTVIRKAFKAWGMTEPVAISNDQGSETVFVSTAQVETGKRVKAMRTVEIIEIDLALLDLSAAGPASGASPIWPSHLPAISGALICYDAGRVETIEGIRKLISLVGLQFPVVMVGCKSDPETNRAIEPRTANALGEPFGVGLIEVTNQTTEGKTKMKLSFSWLLRTIARDRHRREKQRSKEAGTEESLRIQTSFQRKPSQGPTSAADSDTSTGSHALASDKVLWRGSSDRNQLPSFSESLSRANAPRGLSRSGSFSSNSSWSGVPLPSKEQPSDTPSEKLKHLKIEDAQEDLASATKSRNQSQKEDDLGVEAFQALDRLYSRLFFAIASGIDHQFVKQFFLCFRRFCRPADLVSEFLARISEVGNGEALPRDVKLWTLMKLGGALVDWTTLYPGDFASSASQTSLRNVYHIIIEYPHLAHLAGEMAIFVGKLDELVDIDQSWAIPETNQPRDATADDDLPEDLSMSIHGTYLEYANSASSPSVQTSDPKDSTRTSFSTSSLPQAPLTASTADFSQISLGRERKASGLNVLDQSSDGSRSLHAGDSSDVDSIENQGSSRWLPALAWLSRSDEHQIAVELTRHQWELFKAIRPRDIFRHDFGKERGDSVARSIEHFNHLSRWVSSLILAHPKAKHRAKVYEQFMLVAHQLRKLNNYDSLYAVISGMRETSVHRLAQTHALVRLPANLQKDFQSHLKLMDPRGGYVTYRRALQSDASHGRSAIPLLTNILGLVNRLQVIRPEDRRKPDGFVQWDKFAQFGDILFVISDCQARGCPVALSVTASGVQKWLSETPVISSEDQLFERSKLLESGGPPSNAATVLKRLRTFGFHD